MRACLPACAGLSLILLVTACSTPVPTLDPMQADAVIYVIHRGWHTDIGLPAEEITGPLTTLEKPFPGVRFLTFGFGERQFLIDHKRTWLAMLSALLPSRSALLMTALRAPPVQAFGPENVVALRLSQAGLSRIEAAIWQEFETSVANEAVPLADGPYPGSVYYAAQDTYDGFYTCNTWTAVTLQAGGLPMPAGVLFASQVIGRARWIGQTQASALRQQTMPVTR